MKSNVANGTQPLKRETMTSACVRLHQLYGESPKSWENRMSGEASDYRRVARMNRVLCDLGLQSKVAELMAPIEASLAACARSDAQHREAVTDAEEDLAQEMVRAEPCERTVKHLLRVRALMRAAALADDMRMAAEWRIEL